MKLYIARNKDGYLNLYPSEPKKLEERGVFVPKHIGPYIGCFTIDKKEYPEVTWENSPKQVEIYVLK